MVTHTSIETTPCPIGQGASEAPEPSAMTPQLAAYLARKSSKSFVARLRDLPMSGTKRLHNAIYDTALVGLSEGLSPEVVRDRLLEAAIEKNRAPWTANREVCKAVSNAHSYLFDSDPNLSVEACARSARIPRPKINVDEILRIASGGENLANLEAMSGPIPPAEISLLLKLFGISALVCCGTYVETCETRKVADWPNYLRELQFIVPNQMTKIKGINQQGEPSSRCLDNTGPRKYIVIEFDFKPGGFVGWEMFFAFLEAQNLSVTDINAILHIRLQQLWPLGMVVFSGNESLHGWYPVNGADEESQNRFMQYAGSLGADPQLFTRCQAVRIPGGTRAINGAVQFIKYFNPNLF